MGVIFAERVFSNFLTLQAPQGHQKVKNICFFIAIEYRLYYIAKDVTKKLKRQRTALFLYMYGFFLNKAL